MRVGKVDIVPSSGCYEYVYLRFVGATLSDAAIVVSEIFCVFFVYTESCGRNVMVSARNLRPREITAARPVPVFACTRGAGWKVLVGPVPSPRRSHQLFKVPHRDHPKWTHLGRVVR